MCINSCVVTTAYVFLLLAVLACTLSYCGPFWILFPSGWGSYGGGSPWTKLGSLYVTKLSDYDPTSPWWVAGLWGACKYENDQPECRWFWENEFYAERRQRDWHKATQGLFGAGVILLIVGFCLATFHVCCRCCKESFSIGSAIGSFIITGTICAGVGLGLYGGFMAHEFEVGFDDKKVMFYWGYFVGIAGTLLALVSSLLFFCQGCCNRSHTGYHMTRVV